VCGCVRWSELQAQPAKVEIALLRTEAKTNQQRTRPFCKASLRCQMGLQGQYE
jgi:hypothetical protein